MAGPFFFAWIDEAEVFDAGVHSREDEDVFDFTLAQTEGDFATLTISIRNPRVGLLAPGRQIWAFFSWQNPATLTVFPLFKGRLIGVPTEIQANVIQMEFVARPSDFAAQKLALAETMKVRPYWDGIWFDDAARPNPDNVLEFRPEAWHIDRVTHVVTSSNIINGEDGTFSFTEDQTFFDSIHVTYTQNPLRNVQVTAAVSWDQIGSGVISPNRWRGLTPGQVIRSYTGEGLAAGWPTPGASIGGGWTWTVASAVPTGMIDSSLIGEIVYVLQGGDFTEGVTIASHYVDGGFDTSFGTWSVGADGQNIGWSYHVAIPNVTVTWQLQLAWDANRRKTENLSFTLSADVQDIFTLASDGEVLALTLQSSEVSNAIDSDAFASSAGGSIPIRTPTARGYFNTTRGAQSIESLIAIARANLLARARAVRVDFDCQFADFVTLGIDLRHNAVINDPRLPGTAAGGKIVAYQLSLTDGAPRAQATLGCTIGKDGTHVEITGAPDYVADGYVDPGYQTFTGAFSLPFAADIAYEDQQNVVPNDDGLDFLRNLAGTGIDVQLLNGNATDPHDETQVEALGRFSVSVDDAGRLTAVNTRYAQLSVTVPDLTGGPFVTDYVVNMTDLKIPRTIDLEASSEGVSS